MTTRCHVVCVVGEEMGAGKGRERGRWRVLLSKMWWRDPSGRRIPSQSSSDRCIAISSCPLRCHVVSTQKSPPPPPCEEHQSIQALVYRTRSLWQAHTVTPNTNTRKARRQNSSHTDPPSPTCGRTTTRAARGTADDRSCHGHTDGNAEVDEVGARRQSRERHRCLPLHTSHTHTPPAFSRHSVGCRQHMAHMMDVHRTTHAS